MLLTGYDLGGLPLLNGQLYDRIVVAGIVDGRRACGIAGNRLLLLLLLLDRLQLLRLRHGHLLLLGILLNDLIGLVDDRLAAANVLLLLLMLRRIARRCKCVADLLQLHFDLLNGLLLLGVLLLLLLILEILHPLLLQLLGIQWNALLRLLLLLQILLLLSNHIRVVDCDMIHGLLLKLLWLLLLQLLLRHIYHKLLLLRLLLQLHILVLLI